MFDSPYRWAISRIAKSKRILKIECITAHITGQYPDCLSEYHTKKETWKYNPSFTWSHIVLLFKYSVCYSHSLLFWNNTTVVEFSDERVWNFTGKHWIWHLKMKCQFMELSKCPIEVCLYKQKGRVELTILSLGKPIFNWHVFIYTH